MARMLKCKIVGNEMIAQKIFKLTLEKLDRSKLTFQPGKFFMIKVSEGNSPLLRRPFDWFDYNPRKKELDFVYQILGKGTEILSRRKIGENIEILGPLGKGFNLNKAFGNVLLVAGGVGMPGLGFFCKDINNIQSCSYTLIWGTRTAEQFFDLGPKMMKRIYVVEQENPKNGIEKGLVTDIFIRETRAYKFDYIFTCGPKGMLKAIAKLADEKGIPGQLLYEERMACGFGACMGCAVPKKGGGYLHACTDGPAFEFDQIDWQRVAL